VTPGDGRVLIANAGSSSVKLRVLDAGDRLLDSIDLKLPRDTVDVGAVAKALERWRDVDAVGLRVVHGGDSFTSAVVVDDEVEERLHVLVDLGPLHQPAALALLGAIRHALPSVTIIACFDTTFHATMPAAASTYALPAEWRREWAIRRYGFHGLSHAYASRRVNELWGHHRAGGDHPSSPSATHPTGLRVVTCHLGAGASLAAVIDGRSVDTTMGFTPLEGLVMATRCGSIDPGLVLWLEEHVGMPPSELAHTLEHRSGLLGLAGTSDMRELITRADAGRPDARLALDVYVHHLRAGIAAMTAAMGGLDAIVFTGGVGENASRIRSEAAAGLRFLGIELDDTANGSNRDGDREIGAADAAVRAWVVTAREDLEMARQMRELLAGARGTR